MSTESTIQENRPIISNQDLTRLVRNVIHTISEYNSAQYPQQSNNTTSTIAIRPHININFKNRNQTFVQYDLKMAMLLKMTGSNKKHKLKDFNPLENNYTFMSLSELLQIDETQNNQYPKIYDYFINLNKNTLVPLNHQPKLENIASQHAYLRITSGLATPSRRSNAHTPENGVVDIENVNDLFETHAQKIQSQVYQPDIDHIDQITHELQSNFTNAFISELNTFSTTPTQNLLNKDFPVDLRQLNKEKLLEQYGSQLPEFQRDQFSENALRHLINQTAVNKYSTFHVYNTNGKTLEQTKADVILHLKTLLPTYPINSRGNVLKAYIMDTENIITENNISIYKCQTIKFKIERPQNESSVPELIEFESIPVHFAINSNPKLSII